MREKFGEWKEISWVWARNFAELQTIREKENKIRRWKQVILIRHNGVKNLFPLLSTNRTTKSYQLVTCSIDGRNSRIGGKTGLKQTNGIEEPPWSCTKEILISFDTNHRRKPAPTKFDCGCDPKSLLGLMHFALEAIDGEIFIHVCNLCVPLRVKAFTRLQLSVFSLHKTITSCLRVKHMNAFYSRGIFCNIYDFTAREKFTGPLYWSFLVKT